jgi:hypothetical protein
MRTGEGTRGAGWSGRWKRRQGRDAVGGEGGVAGLVATHERSRAKGKGSVGEGSALMFNFFP